MIDYQPGTAREPALLRPDPPPSLLAGVKIMYAGALVCAAHAAVYALTGSAEKAAIAKKDPHLSASHLAVLGHAVVAAGAVAALAGALLFLWIGRSCRTGRNGARIAGTVFFAIAVLGAIYDFVSPETTLSLVFVAAEVLVGLAAVMLLWQRACTAWFAYFKRPQS